MVGRIATVAVVLLALGAPARAGAQSGGLCPPGDIATFNVNTPGCTLCAAPEECEVACLGPPACFCPAGDTACCNDNPCCFNCPEPKPLACSTISCQCTPESCCFLVCPAPAPASSATGLALLAVALVAFGASAVAVASRRR